MKLKQALKRVIALLPKDKSVFNKVRFISSPSSVFVTNGLQSSLVYVSDPVTDLLCASSIIVKAVKDKGDLAFCNEDMGGGKASICSASNVYTLQGESMSSFPKPIIPEADFEFIEVDLSSIGSVIYSASKTDKNGGLPFIHFGGDFIEATDTSRLCRVECDFPWEGVLPISFFDKWPRKIVEPGFAVDEHFVYFKLDEEYRISSIPAVKYPNTINAVKLSDDLGLGVVSRKAMLETVVQATEVSDIKGVFILFNNDTLNIKALGRDHVLKDYVGSVSMDGMIREGSIAVSGKMLSQCLRNLKGEFINISYGFYPEPLFLRSGDTKVFIWPMLSE